MAWKSCQFLLICLFTIANASDSDAQMQQVVQTFTISSAIMLPVGFPEQTVPMPSELRHEPAARAGFPDFSGDVVKKIRATSTFVQKQAAEAEDFDGWLIALAALGLIVLQLRRKHMSLPQRRIAPYP